MALEVHLLTHGSVDGEEHPETPAAAGNLANTYNNQGRLAEAEGLLVALLVALLATSRRARGSEHPSTLNAATNLAVTYYGQGKHPEAAVLLLDAAGELPRAGGEPPGHLQRRLQPCKDVQATGQARRGRGGAGAVL